MAIKIQVGKKYRDGDGAVCTIVRATKESGRIVFIDQYGYEYTEKGEHEEGCPSKWDLIEEVKE